MARAGTTNPAGLTALTGHTLNLTLTTVFPGGSFSNSVNSNAQLSQAPGALPYGAFGMAWLDCSSRASPKVFRNYQIEIQIL